MLASPELPPPAAPMWQSVLARSVPEPVSDRGDYPHDIRPGYTPDRDVPPFSELPGPHLRLPLPLRRMT